jgi:hypothetical protein
VRIRPKVFGRSFAGCLTIGIVIFVSALVVSSNFQSFSGWSAGIDAPSKVVQSVSTIVSSSTTTTALVNQSQIPVATKTVTNSSTLSSSRVTTDRQNSSSVIGTTNAITTAANSGIVNPRFIVGKLVDMKTVEGNTIAGIIVPLYTQPIDGSWNELISAKESNPGVPVTAIINPDSGPGGMASQAYANGIAQLRAAGIKVVGYVATGYGEIPIGAIEAQVQSYASWYKLDGIFFDEMANSNGTGACATACTLQQYYKDLVSFANNLGLTITIGNPGTSIDPTLEGIMTVLIIYENVGSAATSAIQSSTAGYNRSDFGYISIGVGLNETLAKSYSNYVGWIYMTDYCTGQSVTVCNPYDGLPSYFGSLVSDLAG